MTAPIVEYVASAGQTDFNVPFPFLNRTHVEVLVNGTLTPVLEWENDARLRLVTPLAGGESVVIRRTTPVDQALVQFQNGAILTEEDLNTAVKQLLFKQQELISLYEGSLKRAKIRLAENLGIVTDPEAVMDELISFVLEHEVLENFRQRIADIDLNAQRIIEQAFRTDTLDAALVEAEQARTQLAQTVAAVEQDVADYKAYADGRISTLRGDLDGRISTLRGDLEGLTEMVNDLASSGIQTLIAQERDARIEGDTAIVETMDLIGAKSADNLSFIINTATAKVSPTESLAERLLALAAADGANNAAILNEQTARANADEAITEAVQLLTTRVGSAEADILEERTARANADEAITEAVQLLTTRVGSAEAAILNEQTARANADGALAQTLSLLGAKSQDGAAFILNVDTARVSGTETLAQRLSALNTRFDNVEAAVVNEATARSNADEASALEVSGLKTRVGDAEAALLAEAGARASADSALTQSIQLLTARVGDAEGSILAEAEARANADSALAQTLSLLGSKTPDGAAFVLDMAKTKVDASTSLAQQFNALSVEDGVIRGLIQSEAQARIDEDGVLSSRISSLGTRMDGAEAAIVNEQVARSNGDDALALSVQQLAGRVDGAEAAIQAESQARVSADNAFVGNFTLLGAKTADGTGWNLNEDTVKVGGGVALGARLQGLDVAIGNTNAAVVNEQTARAAGDDALALSVQQLSGRVDGAEAAVVNEQTARAAGDTALSQEIGVVSARVGPLESSVLTLSQAVDGVRARYGVKLNVNGYVTGFVQNNDGAEGSFVVVADRFAVVDPNGGSPFVPFEISGGVTRIKEAAIGSLQIDKLASGALGADVTVNGEMRVGTGKIIWDNGIMMKVTGLGFGTNNQFLEWFGPKMPISQCSEFNATYYLKTNGDAYWGGSLSAGVLKNSNETSSLAHNAGVSLGPFGSNGNPKVITVSYSFRMHQTIYDAYVPDGYSPSATVHLYKGSGAGGQFLGSFTATGGSGGSSGRGPYEPGYYDESMSGSMTYTDNSTETSGYEYYAYITYRATRGHTGSAGPTDIQQRLGIISVEE